MSIRTGQVGRFLESLLDVPPEQAQRLLREANLPLATLQDWFLGAAAGFIRPFCGQTSVGGGAAVNGMIQLSLPPTTKSLLFATRVEVWGADATDLRLMFNQRNTSVLTIVATNVVSRDRRAANPAADIRSGTQAGALAGSVQWYIKPLVTGLISGFERELSILLLPGIGLTAYHATVQKTLYANFEWYEFSGE